MQQLLGMKEYEFCGPKAVKIQRAARRHQKKRVKQPEARCDFKRLERWCARVQDMRGSAIVLVCKASASKDGIETGRH